MMNHIKERRAMFKFTPIISPLTCARYSSEGGLVLSVREQKAGCVRGLWSVYTNEALPGRGREKRQQRWEGKTERIRRRVCL